MSFGGFLCEINKLSLRREVCDFCPRPRDVALALVAVQREELSRDERGHSSMPSDLRQPWVTLGHGLYLLLLLSLICRMGAPAGFFPRPLLALPVCDSGSFPVPSLLWNQT